MATSTQWRWGWLVPTGDGAPRVISVLEPATGLGDIMVDGVPPDGVRPLSVLGSSWTAKAVAATSAGQERVAQVMSAVGGPAPVTPAQSTGARALSPRSRSV
jgi:hypothetical protein